MYKWLATFNTQFRLEHFQYFQCSCDSSILCLATLTSKWRSSLQEQLFLVSKERYWCPVSRGAWLICKWDIIVVYCLPFDMATDKRTKPACWNSFSEVPYGNWIYWVLTVKSYLRERDGTVHTIFITTNIFNLDFSKIVPSVLWRTPILYVPQTSRFSMPCGSSWKKDPTFSANSIQEVIRLYHLLRTVRFLVSAQLPDAKYNDITNRNLVLAIRFGARFIPNLV